MTENEEVRKLAEIAAAITDSDAERDNEVTDLSQNQVMTHERWCKQIQI